MCYDVTSPTYKWDDCGLVHSETLCPLPAVNLAHQLYFVPEDCTSCPVCSAGIWSKNARYTHFLAILLCRQIGQTHFWHSIKLLWECFDLAEKIKLAATWWKPVASPDTGKEHCPGCTGTYCDRKSWMSRHIRVAKDSGCWHAVWTKFLTECDAVGDDDRDKLLVFAAMGINDDGGGGFI